MNETIASLQEKAEQTGFLATVDIYASNWSKSEEIAFAVPQIVYSAPIEALPIDDALIAALHNAGFTVMSDLMKYLGENSDLARRLHISQNVADELRGTVIDYFYRCLSDEEKRAFWKEVLKQEGDCSGDRQ